MRKSYIVNVSRVETSPGTDYAARVSVAVCGISAGIANECSHTQRKSGLVSRTAFTARLARIGRRNKGNRSASGLRHRNQNLFGHSNRAVRSLLCHRALGQKARLEILDGNAPKSGHNFTRPLESSIFPLPRNSQMDSSDRSFGFPSLVRAVLCAGQFALRPLQRLCVILGLIAARQVKVRISSCGDSGNSPINSDCLVRVWKRFVFPPNDKGHVPIPNTITSDDAGFRLTRKLPAPNDRNENATCEAKPAFFEIESICCVFQRRKCYLAAVKLWKAFSWLLERLLVCRVPFSHRLLLDNTRTFTKPVVFSAKCGEFLGHAAERWRFVLNPFFEHFVGSVSGLNALIPNIAGAVPFEDQAGFGDLAGAKSKRVSDSGLVLAHRTNLHTQPVLSQQQMEAYRGPR